MTRSLPGAHSQFDALNIKYDHTFNAGLTLLTTYQWSKAMDNGPEDFLGWATGNQWRDAYNTNLDYNISTHDVPQSFATALVYDEVVGGRAKWIWIGLVTISVLAQLARALRTTPDRLLVPGEGQGKSGRARGGS